VTEVEPLILLRKVIGNYDNLTDNTKAWLENVVNRLERNEQDLRTYLAMVKSDKDMSFLNSLKLTKDMSYYVVSDRREFLEKFRVYMQVCVPKTFNDYISFTEKVFLNTYVRQVNDDKFNIDELILSRKRLQIYCHKNNHMTDKQTAWIQGNLFTSDVCDRLIRGSKLLILSEYPLDEVEDMLSSFKLRKIVIKKNDMKLHNLYTVAGNTKSKSVNELGEVEG
jgi:hypothetical protein